MALRIFFSGSVRVPVAVSRFEECPGEQAENAGQGHGRKTTARLLALALRPVGLVGRSVRQGEACAIDEFDVTPVPELVVGDMTLDAINQMGIDLIHHIKGDFRTGLTLGAGIGAHGGVILARESSAPQGHDLANRFAAGAVGRLDLIEKAPENDIQREDAPAVVGAGRCSGEQGLRNVGSEGLAQQGKGGAFRELGKSLGERGNRGLSKEKGTEALEERC